VTEIATFAAGLLNPTATVPQVIKRQSERCYAVYRNNVTVGLVRALESNFPAIRRLLGQAYFAGFARAFAQTHPPRSPLMFEYGSEFPEALARDHDLSSFPYLSDVARLEILWRKSYHATDAEPMSPNALSTISADHLPDCKLSLHPAMRLLRSDYAIYDVFLANRFGGTERALNAAQSQCALITRPHYDVSIQLLTQAQHAFFDALQSGETLGHAMEDAQACDDTIDLGATLALLIQSGAFSGITTNPKEHQ
jgi:hypothetical protein